MQSGSDERELILSLSKKNGAFEVKFCRGSGPGGQNKNKRNTAAIVTHLASGLSKRCETYRTQEKNKEEAFRRLVTSQEFMDWLRVELARQGVEAEIEVDKELVNQRVRTYNFPRDEVIDHRTGKKVKGVQAVLDGNLDKLKN